ncbi:MAG: hypothetical protein HOL66_16425 [Rhodospirillaceae bacterium]|nr:hypothetical protein [Rhodospirillaceae bacterium]
MYHPVVRFHEVGADGRARFAISSVRPIVRNTINRPQGGVAENIGFVAIRRRRRRCRRSGRLCPAIIRAGDPTGLRGVR